MASPYDFIGSLKFEITEVPKWREKSRKTTTAMLSDIVKFYERYEELPQPAKQFCKDNFARLMAMKFVLDVNIGESVGTQTADGTQAVLEDYIEKQLSPSNLDSSEDGGQGGVTVPNKVDSVVTINVYKILMKFVEMHDEMERTSKVTVQQIYDCHRVLMENMRTRKDAGELRTTCVRTIWKDEVHIYPESIVAEQILYACVDHHCIHMTHYEELTKTAAKEESFSYLFKCAAGLLFDFVDAHPFGDGNGRMCRLLGNYVLSLITPFPVALYSHGSEEGRCGREDYIHGCNCGM